MNKTKVELTDHKLLWERLLTSLDEDAGLVAMCIKQETLTLIIDALHAHNFMEHKPIRFRLIQDLEQLRSVAFPEEIKE